MSRYNPVGISCPEHGYQYGRTRCRCGFDPLFPKHSSSSAVKGASLQPTGNGVAAFSIPLDLVNDQFQRDADVIE